MNFQQVSLTLPAGWLQEDEAELLWREAENSSGTALEIGTYLGRSAVLIARAIGPTRQLICVDPFLQDFDDVKTLPADEIFENALRNLSAYNNVSIVREYEEDYRRHFEDPLGLLYLDGDHSYGGTLGAIQRWAPLCHGPILLHDYGLCPSFEGVKRAVRDYGLKVVQQAGSLAVCRK